MMLCTLFRCLWSVLFWDALYSHSGHLNGRSPVCVRTWRLRSLTPMNVLLQMLHNWVRLVGECWSVEGMSSWSMWWLGSVAEVANMNDEGWGTDEDKTDLVAGRIWRLEWGEDSKDTVDSSEAASRRWRVPAIKCPSAPAANGTIGGFWLPGAISGPLGWKK